MDYSRETLSERLAAEYALGTLRGAARRRFETLLPAHPRLREATLEWQRRLQVLEPQVPPQVQPGAQVWLQIQRRLFGASTNAELPLGLARARSALTWWRAWAGVSTTALLALAIWSAQPGAVTPPVVVVLSAQNIQGAASDIRPASFVASVSGDGRSLVIKPLDAQQMVTLHKALELWAVPPKGAPRSLGVISQTQLTTVVRSQLLTNTAALALSVEPPGGSPSGAPTGPVVSVGKLSI